MGVLFNDILMLTTPDEPIDKPDDFKLTKSSDLSLTLYKIPIRLHRAQLQVAQSNTGGDPETAILIQNGKYIITVVSTSYPVI